MTKGSGEIIFKFKHLVKESKNVELYTFICVGSRGPFMCPKKSESIGVIGSGEPLALHRLQPDFFKAGGCTTNLVSHTLIVGITTCCWIVICSDCTARDYAAGESRLHEFGARYEMQNGALKFKKSYNITKTYSHL